MQADEASVLRDGRLITVPAAQLVPGDVVEVTGKYMLSQHLCRKECQEEPTKCLPSKIIRGPDKSTEQPYILLCNGNMLLKELNICPI